MKVLLIFIYGLTMAQANTPTPSPTNFDDSSFFHFTVKSGEDAQTYRMLDDQNRIMDSGSRSIIALQDSIVTGTARAKEMTELLKNQELQHAFGDINKQGKQTLQENPDLQSPVAIIGGAAALWIGRTIQLVKEEKFKIESRFEGRARSGEFSLQSPILNGKLSYNGGDGVSMNVNRKIDSIQSSAEMNYSQKDQTISGQLVHPLTPHLNLSFGAAQLQQTNQTDGRAGIQYNLNF